MTYARRGRTVTRPADRGLNLSSKAHTLLGLVASDRGDLDRAAACFQQSMVLYHNGDQSGMAYSLNNLGYIKTPQRHHDHAADLQRQALALFQSLGERAGEALTLDGLATAYAALGQFNAGCCTLKKALTIAREIGDPRTEVAALNSLGEVTRAAGQYGQAVAHHTAAHTLAADADIPAEQARAHRGLGWTHLAMQHQTHARTHFEQALSCYTELGMREAREMRDILAKLAPITMGFEP
jgi:tetratricopeptide (TPR) repeat protein